jgi:hypothetical protein
MRRNWPIILWLDAERVESDTPPGLARAIRVWLVAANLIPTPDIGVRERKRAEALRLRPWLHCVCFAEEDQYVAGGSLAGKLSSIASSVLDQRGGV